MSDKTRIKKIHCNSCLHETNHTVLASEKQSEGEERGWGWIGLDTTYEMLKCLGCDSISLRRRLWFSEWGPGDEPEVDYYPPRVSRRKFQGLKELNDEVKALIDEVYVALHADCRRLAMMGTRTIVDCVMRDTIGDEGTFKQRLDRLAKDGHVGVRDSEFLESVIEAGNAAAHRGYCPSASDLNSVMDIVESVLQSVYILHGKANTVKQNTPSRHPKGESNES